ncbi:MAG TPA: pantoate--beta-alanine ligase [Puia sp.]|nr:pantoate--beta-alanine ligase [Puia sp.]
MILFKRAVDLTGWLEKEKAGGRSVGFVPTMGALHSGHISLIAISKRSTQITVCSIFINPTQFNDARDYQKYPVTLENDIALLEEGGADVLFLPAIGELYPDGTKTLEQYDLNGLDTVLEGQFRPGHFQGVCQVMFRLLQLVRPDRLFMGQKDYQQCMVVQRLLSRMGLHSQLERCPIVREPGGLAMSSRNLRLTADQRERATALYRALQHLKEKWHHSGDDALAGAATILRESGCRSDYICVADRDTLQPLQPGDSRPAIALIAAFLGEVRLIDNMPL